MVNGSPQKAMAQGHALPGPGATSKEQEGNQEVSNDGNLEGEWS
jgi:hypothetical protein